ncbi:MAG TPA: 30S ribosomal protein S6 [Halanaerobiaceae bacterium]|jgi:small subunit ribosomal protein S6|nr:30S ribosomal protein S6 [Bacillota bacterium]HHU91894.1 30S ribosomal protein S6 [Halanaerobiaceae bacterium]HOA40795.1 30S ribosomal protein S6 [Halanaerobiales bacterium]HPZ63001.1 30S ribosomal protein S6 [Halanaerobiales bacterium]HQD04190.1 30S ribosomal protein S6 [Halanaerobiales bacterium]
MTRLYETVFVLRPDLDEEARDGLVERIKGIITDNQGEIVEEDIWGNRKLAYEINKYDTGYYVLLTFKGGTALVKELERNYRILDGVLRSLIINKED